MGSSVEANMVIRQHQVDRIKELYEKFPDISYTDLGVECGVSPNTAKKYVQLLKNPDIKPACKVGRKNLLTESDYPWLIEMVKTHKNKTLEWYCKHILDTRDIQIKKSALSNYFGYTGIKYKKNVFSPRTKPWIFEGNSE